MITVLYSEETFKVKSDKEERNVKITYSIKCYKDRGYLQSMSKCIIEQPGSDIIWTSNSTHYYGNSHRIELNILKDTTTDKDIDKHIIQMFETQKETFRKTCKNRIAELLKGGKII